MGPQHTTSAHSVLLCPLPCRPTLACHPSPAGGQAWVELGRVDPPTPLSQLLEPGSETGYRRQPGLRDAGSGALSHRSVVSAVPYLGLGSGDRWCWQALAEEGQAGDPVLGLVLGPHAHVSLTLGGWEGPERPRMADESLGAWMGLSLGDSGVKFITRHY